MLLKNSGLTICRPGWNSSARMTSAMVPPTRNMVNENHRYIVPMSLWLVVVTQRMNPLEVRDHDRDGRGRVVRVPLPC